jgi:hypothetical protein
MKLAEAEGAVRRRDLQRQWHGTVCPFQPQKKFEGSLWPERCVSSTTHLSDHIQRLALGGLTWRVLQAGRGVQRRESGGLLIQLPGFVS